MLIDKRCNDGTRHALISGMVGRKWSVASYERLEGWSQVER